VVGPLAHCAYCGKTHNIGFVSTRFAGTDGVSLETEKWAVLFEKLGFNCYYFAGKLDRPRKQSYREKEAHFRHPDIRSIYRSCFGVLTRQRSTTQKIFEIKQKLKDHLYDFIKKFNIHLLIPENALAIPLNLPLSIALTKVISETGIPTIAHHHDFLWERQHFLVNAVWEYINMAFPPHLPSMKHVVINSSASNQLSLRTGISATIIPNVMDSNHPPNFEGFGNAFLEAIYFRKPVVVNTYFIYTMDIKPKGFFVIEIDGYVTDKAVRKTRDIIKNPAHRRKMVDHNYKMATRYYSYATLHKKLKNLISDYFSCIA
jgi:hypothetical protein